MPEHPVICENWISFHYLLDRIEQNTEHFERGIEYGKGDGAVGSVHDLSS
ncbi:MAG: hypothetical protein MI748_03860 [Opitutales bacterium]|nr:hypothetical protein [Opitutales bacterium]